MKVRRTKILFLTKWYLHRNDPQFAVFINKHAKAISEFADVAVLHVMSDVNLHDQTFDEVIQEEKALFCVQVYFKKDTGIFSGVVNGYRYLSGIGKGLKRINEKFGDYDLIHAYILLRPALIALCLKFLKGKKYIISEQWSGYATGKFSQRNFLVKILSRFVVAQAKAVTTVSEFLKESMLRSGLKGDYFVIPNIIEISLAATVKKNPGDKIRILVVADLVDEIKNISGTISAFSVAFHQQMNSELNIIGHGKDENKLKNLVQELQMEKAVFFHGVKSNEDVYSFINKSDFIVMNSNFETFSLICAEAIACGKPVVATRCGGPQEFITKENGILIDPGNQQQLETAIQEMMSHFQDYDPGKLKQYAIQKFSEEEVGKKFFNLYTTILSK